MTEAQALGLLKSASERETQKALARRLGISQAYLCDVLHERRSPETILRRFGYERVITYRQIMADHGEAMTADTAKDAELTAKELAEVVARAQFLVERAEPDSHAETLANNVIVLAGMLGARDARIAAIEGEVEAARMHARETVARWMIGHSLVTGHGDTIEDLLTEAWTQVATLRPVKP